jgi:hypothetical protein
MCCYDGVYLKEGEEEQIRETVRSYPEFFSFLPLEYVVYDNWRNRVEGRKTAVRPYHYQNSSFPDHFNQTRCVFCLPDARCSLQVLSVNLGEHPWSRKPKGCWMHPLRENASGIIPPPTDQTADADLLDTNYPGFISHTLCGQHQADGQPYYEVLIEEIEYYQARQLRLSSTTILCCCVSVL